MSICGGNFSFFSTSNRSYESWFDSNDTKFPISRPNFPSVHLNTCYNNPTTFSLTTTNYLHCLQKCKPNDQDMKSVDVDKCALKQDANATLIFFKQRLIQRLEDYLDRDLVIPSLFLHLFTSQFWLDLNAHDLTIYDHAQKKFPSCNLHHIYKIDLQTKNDIELWTYYNNSSSPIWIVCDNHLGE
jgi:hypothetical protein